MFTNDKNLKNFVTEFSQALKGHLNLISIP